MSITLGCASVMAANTSVYEASVVYIQENEISEDIHPNIYYDPTKESEYHTNVKREVYQKIQFPSHCVMEIVYERFEEVAPPTSSDVDIEEG